MEASSPPYLGECLTLVPKESETVPTEALRKKNVENGITSNDRIGKLNFLGKCRNMVKLHTVVSPL